jgi:hypothetical protein
MKCKQFKQPYIKTINSLDIILLHNTKFKNGTELNGMLLFHDCNQKSDKF